jgi:hypothetical protein
LAYWSVAGAVVPTLLAGLLPAAAMMKTMPGDALKRGSRATAIGGRWRHRAVVAAQFGLALVLLAGAGLFGETLIRLGNQPLGFWPEPVIVASVTGGRPTPAVLTPTEREKRRAERADFLKQLVASDPVTRGGLMSMQLAQTEWTRVGTLLTRVATLPGVKAVAAADSAPFTAGVATSGRARAGGQLVEEAQLVEWHRVSERYFDALGIQILRGRVFADDDRRRLPTSVVISAALERRLFTGNAVGRKLLTDQAAYDVIGVVSDVRRRVRGDDDLAAGYMLIANRDSVKQIVVRTTGDAALLAPALRETIEHHDAPMFVTSDATMPDLVAGTLVVERGRALLSGLYGLAALLLATVGLYGLTARLVAERRREIGIRVALGAGRGDIRKLVASDARIIVGIGLAVGLPAALLTSQFAQGMLYGVPPAAPHVLGVAAIALTAAAIIATIVPTVRANRIDPAVTLRED